MDKIWLRQYPAGMPAELDGDPDATVVSLLDDSVRRHRDRPAFRCLGRTLSFAAFDAGARALSAYLQAQGLVRGERVALMLPNLPQLPVAAAAVLRAGCVLVNLDPQAPAATLEHQLRDSGARLIIAIDQAAPTLQPVLDVLPGRRVIVATAGDLLGPFHGRLANHRARRVRRHEVGFDPAGAVRFNDALAIGRRTTAAPVTVAPDDIALLQYTGGTTATPRAAVLLHRNLAANLRQAGAWVAPALARLPPGEQLTMLGALPLSPIFGFTAVLLLGLHLGGCTVLVPDAGDLGALVRLLGRERVHGLPAVDALLDALLRTPGFERIDWSGLRLTLAGATAVQPDTAARWQAATGCAVCEGYGLSEASPCVTCNPVDVQSHDGSIGVPLPGTEVQVLDADDKPVPPGTAGELAIRGPQLMAGYWQRPDDTARVMTADGFLRSGDIATMDLQGRLRLVDRKHDMIVVSGFDVAPAEIEALVTRLPGVRECAAVGVPDARVGEAVKVFIVKDDPDSARPSEADIHAFCEINLTGYKRPKSVEFRRRLPRSAAGKVLRRELREPV